METNTTRRYDLDWLRVLAILTVFLFHCNRFFDLGGWHVKNPTTVFASETITVFLAAWMMPLIFVISGASLFFAITKGGFRSFIKSKSLRLLVPLVVGIFTHVMYQVYLENITQHGFTGTFWQFIPHYFEGFYGFGGNFAWMGLHLWYLLFLFLFSVLMFPLFRWLRGPRGTRLLEALDRFFSLPGAALLLELPVIVLVAVLDPNGLIGNRGFGGWSLPVYLLFFLYGFILTGMPHTRQTIQKMRWILLVLGLALAALTSFIWIGHDPIFGTWFYAEVYGLAGLTGWALILAILGFGEKNLNFSTPFLRYANEAVLPFYVMHQSVILTIGYPVTRLDLPIPVKYILIAVSSFVVVVGLYEFLIRRVKALRFLFGMKV